jgi:hypothetical protein
MMAPFEKCPPPIRNLFFLYSPRHSVTTDSGAGLSARLLESHSREHKTSTVTVMNTIKGWSFGLVAGCVVACCFSSQCLAIEGLKISVPPPSTNVVLSWPSDTSETYLIQYRHTLSETDSWTTLADYYPPDYSGTNITYFYDTNVDHGVMGTGGGSGGGGPILPALSGEETSDAAQLSYWAILPPPLQAELMDKLGLTSDTVTSDSVTPMGSSGSSTNSIVGTGFYRVVRDGVHLVGISNNMVLSGIVKIPVELGNASGQIVSMCISEDDSPVGNSIQCPVSNPYFITLDTTEMTNGVHQINGSARWEDTNGNDWEVDSPTFTVTTSNEITFENWMPAFGQLGNTLLIRATSAHPVTQWEIDVYGSTNNYIGSFLGDTTNGDISVVWDLVDYYGVQHTNDPFFSFTLETQYVDPKTPKTYKQTDPWSGPGGWAFGIQHAFDWLTDVNLLYEEMDGFYNAAKGNFPVGPTTGPEPFAMDFQGGNETNEWYNFNATVLDPQGRNLVYFGHGGPTGLGYDQHNTNVSLTVNQIAAVLHTIPAGQTNAHKFRFVFLDGCSTAKGTLPEAFGIPHKEKVSLTDFSNASIRPCCFCGWSSEKAVGFVISSGINYSHVNFIVHIQEDMLQNGGTIGQGYDYSCSQSDVITILTSEFKIFGCRDLSFGAFNN